MASGKSIQELQEKFKVLAAKSVSDQIEFFLKSFIFALDDKWKEVAVLAKKYSAYISMGGEGYPDLNPIQAADFLQKNGLERTALQRKEEIQDIDLDNNGRICFIEYLLLHYKIMILQEYYKRLNEKPKEDLSGGGIGVTGVGFKLLDELFTIPVGLDPELIRAIEEFAAKKNSREQKFQVLRQQIKTSGEESVQGRKAIFEIKQMENEDATEMNRMEISLEAAKRRSGKSSGEVALQQKKKQQDDEEKKKRDEGRSKIKNMASAWNQQQ